ncbi:MAG TPA: tRNA guanosine(34) transglycosylase Tgt [Verrucomicrobiae bacterium]|nr:tRNA guanosine(34) transglycosylase Tgt [Verrucomicrobiae bacterium]
MSEGPFRVTAHQPGSAARAGVLRTRHGEVATPAFMPVGTHAAVRACHPDEVAATGAQMVLANAIHLELRPGAARIARLGGLHAFMGWPGPILTDSGGYQLVSLDRLAVVDDGGVHLRSPYDGAGVDVTPERALEIQRDLDSDICMVLDHPVAFGASPAAVREATRRTLGWAARSRQAHPRDRLVFGIVQGGFEPEARWEAATAIAALDFDGNALGGLVLGEPPAVRRAATAAAVAALPEDRVRYLMGLATDRDLLEAVGLGVDLFDCVLPTRLARNGVALTPTGRLSLRQARFSSDPRPLQPGCGCLACRRFSRAYLRHGVQVDEILAHRLLSLHNLTHLGTLMAEARAAIARGSFPALCRRRLAALAGGGVPDAGGGAAPPYNEAPSVSADPRPIIEE